MARNPPRTAGRIDDVVVTSDVRLLGGLDHIRRTKTGRFVGVISCLGPDA